MIHYSLHKVFFFLLLLFLPTQLGYHVWPEWAHVLGRRIDYLSPTVYVTDILLVLTIATWIIGSVKRVMNHELGIMVKKKTIIHYSLFLIQRYWSLLPLSLFVVLNIVLAQSPFVAFYKWIKVFEFLLLGYYIVKTKPTLLTISIPLSIGVCYSSLIAIGQFFLQHSIDGPLWFLGERTFGVDTPGIAKIQICGLSAVDCRLLLRAYGTFPHPNVLGGFLATVMPLIIIQFSNYSILKLSKKIFYGVTLLLGIIALGFTFSRSAIVVGVMGIVFTIARIKNHELGIMEKSIVSVSLFAVILASLFIIPLSWGDESVVVRQQLNAVAVQQWWSSPTFGVGLGNFLVRLPETLPTRAIYFLQPVHNIYLLLLSEVGVVGIGLIVIAAWKLVGAELGIMNYELWKKRINAKPIIHYSLFIILLLGLVDHYPLTLQQGQLLMTLFFALSFAL